MRKLRFKVVDNVGQAYEEDFWLTIADPQQAAPDKAPYIVGGGYDGIYLDPSKPTVTFRAFVEDSDGDDKDVFLLDQNFGTPPIPMVRLSQGVYSLTVPNGFPTGNWWFKMIAVDNAGHTSPEWPFMTIDGGPPGGEAGFEPPADQTGQDESTTPTIDYVELPRHTIPAAEVTDAVGTQTIRAIIRPLPSELEDASVTVVARIRHVIPGVKNPDEIELQLGPPPIANLYEGSFTPPSGWAGWGRYTVNVQVRAVKDGVTYYSDWWPQLRAH